MSIYRIKLTDSGIHIWTDADIEVIRKRRKQRSLESLNKTRSVKTVKRTEKATEQTTYQKQIVVWL